MLDTYIIYICCDTATYFKLCNRAKLLKVTIFKFKFFFQVGPRDAPPVLLVHGWLDNCYSFVPLLTQLPLDKRYIAIDLPGHGHSSHKPKSAYTNLLGKEIQNTKK